MVLAIAIFCLLAVWDFIFTLVWYISYPIGKIIYPFTGAPKSRRYPGAFKMPDGPMVDNSHS